MVTEKCTLDLLRILLVVFLVLLQSAIAAMVQVNVSVAKGKDTFLSSSVLLLFKIDYFSMDKSVKSISYAKNLY